MRVGPFALWPPTEARDRRPHAHLLKVGGAAGPRAGRPRLGAEAGWRFADRAAPPLRISARSRTSAVRPLKAFRVCCPGAVVLSDPGRSTRDPPEPVSAVAGERHPRRRHHPTGERDGLRETPNERYRSRALQRPTFRRQGCLRPSGRLAAHPTIEPSGVATPGSSPRRTSAPCAAPWRCGGWASSPALLPTCSWTACPTTWT